MSEPLLHQKIQRPVDGRRLGVALILALELVQQLVGTLRTGLSQQQRQHLTTLGRPTDTLIAAMLFGAGKNTVNAAHGNPIYPG